MKQLKLDSKILRRQLINNRNRMVSILGMPLTNANGAIDPNSTGFEYVIKTTSEIRSRIIEQKFYKVAPADYMPVDVGEAAWKDEIIQQISYDNAGNFFQGDVDTLQGNGRIAEVDALMAPIRMPTQIWAKGVSWNVSQVAQAAASGNWDIIESKMKSLKKNWDLGIQEVAFMGHPTIPAMTGLINNPEVTINTTLLPVAISAMTPPQFTAFLGILKAYFANSQSTELPDTFVMPADDYLGLSIPYNENYPSGPSRLEYMLNAFKKMTQNENFKILPLAYCQAEINAARGINKNRYALYRKDPETLSLSIPVDFSMYEAGTANNIFWQQPAMGQYSGVLVNRAPEVLYIDRVA